MKVMVIGCGRLGAELATRLSQQGHFVSVVDITEDAFIKLPIEFMGVTNEGDALNRDVLHRAGIEKMDAVAVVTGSDILNAVLGHLIKVVYHLKNVIVRNSDPGYRQLHETFGLQIISASSWGAQRIEELVYHADVRMVFSAGNGEIEVYEIYIPDHCDGIELQELVKNKDCLPISITRAGRAFLPEATMKVMSGDMLHVSATMEGISALRKQLCEPVKEEK
jgi:trk system potassium uptake protein TrkA